MLDPYYCCRVKCVSSVPPEQLILRGYQKELASDGLRGDNCLVVAPTGTGKTLIALAIAKVLLGRTCY